jgi:uncharacterized protein (TIGR02145 family)
MKNHISKYLIIGILVVSVTNCKKKDADPVPAVPTPITIKPIDFGSSTFGTVTDNDGNTYKTIVIGGKTWMAENLKSTRYNNGAALLTGLSDANWTSETTGAFCDYENKSSNGEFYGHLYNEYVKLDQRGICPSGWHIPSNGEWLALGAALGGVNTAGGKMKEKGTAHWITPNEGGDNSSGFTGIPGGSRHNGIFNDMGTDGYWWSSDPGFFFYLTNSLTELRTKPTAKPDEGLSIRCIKD